MTSNETASFEFLSAQDLHPFLVGLGVHVRHESDVEVRAVRLVHLIHWGVHGSPKLASLDLEELHRAMCRSYMAASCACALGKP